jgi:hypothetical protein
MTRHDQTQGDLLKRVRAEYEEMPRLNLTPAQAQRLWHLDPEQCDRLLSRLVEERFLHRTRQGTFALAERLAA